MAVSEAYRIIQGEPPEEEKIDWKRNFYEACVKKNLAYYAGGCLYATTLERAENESFLAFAFSFFCFAIIATLAIIVIVNIARILLHDYNFHYFRNQNRPVMSQKGWILVFLLTPIIIYLLSALASRPQAPY